jgi:serine/threonine protein kinase/tetratricopeptide (TPR) repeat protein
VDSVLGTDRFTFRRRLGAGSFGVVYEAFDRERHLPVALKLLHEPWAASLYRFKQEFRALADLAHPNLVSPYELLNVGSNWFFTMELVRGGDLLRFLRADGPDGSSPSGSFATASRGFRSAHPSHPSSASEEPEEFSASPSLYSAPPDFEAIQPCLVQVAEGLQALHEAGILHRDLKPGNVLVTPEGHVKILDFGLAFMAPAPEGPLERPDSNLGTPAYMAPEQLEGQPPSEASDWYALGVMLYQVLTGQLPFTGNPLEMAKAKRSLEACPPSLLLSSVPPALENLCLELLQRDPALRPTGPQVLAALGSEICLLHPNPLAAASALPAPQASRTRELGQLLEAFASLPAKGSTILHLHGASGLGKTFLLRRFLREIRRIMPEALILPGRCFEQEAVPFKAMDTVVDALYRHLVQLPLERLVSLLPPHGQALARLFPVLQQLSPLRSVDPAGEVPDPVEFRRRAFEAFRVLLERLGAEGPVVLAIDDVHWGDLDSAELLLDVFGGDAPPPILLLLCSMDAPEQSTAMLDRLEAVPAFQRRMRGVELKELPPGEAQSLAAALLGPDYPDGRAAERIAQESGGNPFYIGEMARQVRAGTLPPEGTLDGYLAARLASLDPGAQRVLQTLALAASPLPLGTLQQASGVEEEGPRFLTQLRTAHLVRALAGTQRRMLETYHSRIREAALESLTPDALREAHLRLALALEASADANPEAIATHFEGGGDLGKAAEFAALAGEKAFAALAFDRAAHLFQKSLDLRPPGHFALPRLRVALGDALASAGRSAEAGLAYQRAAAVAPAQEARGLLRRASEEFLRAGRIDEGVAILQDVLRSVGITYPASYSRALASALFSRLRLRLRGLRFRERSREDIPPALLEKVDVLWAAAMGLGPVDLLRGASFQARNLLATLQAGEPFRLVRALAHEAAFVAQHGTRSRAAADRVVATAMRLAETVGHPKSLSRAYLAAGITANLQGRWGAATQCMDQAASLLRDRCTGVDYELHLANHHGLIARQVMGQFIEVGQRLPRLLKEARDRGDLLALTDLRTNIEAVQLLVEDRPEAAREALREAIGAWTQRDFHTQHYHALSAGASIELYAGDARVACSLLEAGWAGLERSFLLQVQGIAITMEELRARVHLALAVETSGPRPRAAHLAQARRAMKRLARQGAPYGEALLGKLKALEALVEGDEARARGHLLAAEAAFQDCEMAAHVMALRRARGRLEDSPEVVASADAWFLVQGVRRPARFTAMHLPAPIFRS